MRASLRSLGGPSGIPSHPSARRWFVVRIFLVLLVASGSGLVPARSRAATYPWLAGWRDDDPRPANVTLEGSASLALDNSDWVLRLVPPRLSQFGIARITPPAGTPAWGYHYFSASFDFLFWLGNGADGMSFNYGPPVAFPGPAEDGLNSGLSISFDSYRRAFFPERVYVKYNGVVLNPGGTGIDLWDANWEHQHSSLEAFYDETGLTVIVREVERASGLPLGVWYLVQNYPVPDWRPLPHWQFNLAGRTGGNVMDILVDNLRLQTRTSPPEILGLPEAPIQVVEDGSTTLDFRVTDFEEPGGSTLSVACDDPEILANDGITLSPWPDSVGRYVLHLHPNPNASGLARMVVTASQGGETTRRGFLVQVLPSNDPPELQIPALETVEDLPIVTSLGVNDPDTPPEQITVTATSSNPEVLEDSDLVITGTGSVRNLTLTPLPNRNTVAQGPLAIRFVVSDGLVTTTREVQVTVTPANDVPVAGPRSGLSFQPVDAAVTIADTGLAAGNTAHTLEAWVKPLGAPSARSWLLELGAHGPGAHHWLLLPQSATNVMLQFGAWDVSPQVTGIPLPLGEWSHLAAVWDGTNYAVYLDGQRASDPITPASPFVLREVEGAVPLSLGQRSLGSERNFAGQLDEIRLWNRALEASEIQRRRLLPLRGDEEGLLAYWRLDEGQATTVFDSAGAGGHAQGRLTGGASWASGLKRETYSETTGELASLRALRGFPGKPDSVSYLTDVLEAPTNVADHYGQRVSGILFPPATGNYLFEIASDDQSELRLSTNDLPAHAVTIAQVDTWTGPREWNNPRETRQQSVPIRLEAGKRYYLEALMAAGDGTDHLAVRWRLPDGRIEEPIPASRFEYNPRFGPRPVGEDEPTPIYLTGFDVELAQAEPEAQLFFEILVPPEHGTLNLSAGRLDDLVVNPLRYTPATNYNGPDQFTYRLRDTTSAAGPFSPPATVGLEVRGQNDAPTLSDIPDRNILENETSGPISFTITDSDHAPEQLTIRARTSDPDLLPLAAIAVRHVAGTTFELILTPRRDEIGTATVTLVATDPADGVGEDQIKIRVDPRPAYALLDLGPLERRTQTFGAGVNDSAWAVGSGQSQPGDSRATLFRGFVGDGQLESIAETAGFGTAGTASEALAINAANSVVGTGTTSVGGAREAFRWERGQMQNLAPLIGGSDSVAYALNDTGDIAGSTLITLPGLPPRRTAFVLRAVGGVTNIPNLPSLTPIENGEALGINNLGIAVGYQSATDGPDRAFRFGPAGVEPVIQSVHDSSRALGINDDGLIVGWFRLAQDQPQHAFLAGAAPLVDLGTIPGGTFSVARAINKFGQVVGEGDDAEDHEHAWIRTGGRIFDLTSLMHDSRRLVFAQSGWQLRSARAISPNGTITGTGILDGNPRAYLALPAWVIGRQIPRPEGAVARLPEIELLDRAEGDNAQNAFFWSSYEKKLYAVRPVTARLKWFTSFRDTLGSGTNVVSNLERLEAIGITVWPREPITHVAETPVDIEPKGVGFQYGFQSILYETTGGSALVDPTSKTFNSQKRGYSVLYYLETFGNQPSPADQRLHLDVTRTVLWNDPAYLQERSATVGQALTDPAIASLGDPGHQEHHDRNGFVFFERSPYDGAGTDRAYDRPTRLGPITPVNLDTESATDDLVVVWYRLNDIGVAWGGKPVRYRLSWPPDDVVSRLVIASTRGSGPLPPLSFPNPRVYHQPDPGLPGYNPNEEHALIAPGNDGTGEALFALRNDLNDAIKPRASEPYSILKYRDLANGAWLHRVFKVVAEQAAGPAGQPAILFEYSGVAGNEIQPPYPLSRLNLCTESHGLSGPYWEDHLGRLYARAAGAEGQPTNIVLRWFYPLQPDFFYDLDRDGTPDAAVGTSLAWLDHRAARSLISPPNAGPGNPGTPLEVTYRITWPRTPTLQIGETLLRSKRQLPAVKDMARLSVIYDDLAPGWDPAQTTAPLTALARLYDPLSTRVLALQTTDVLPPGLARVNRQGKEVFSDLSYVLRSRLRYDPIQHTLEFSGLLDESSFAGEPLLLPNVLTSRERDAIQSLAVGDATWKGIVDRLYDLTRNPHGVDLDPLDQTPDVALRLGLITEYTYRYTESQRDPLSGMNREVTVQKKSLTRPTSDQIAALDGFVFVSTNVIPEPLGALPKALSAGYGGITAALPRPGRALSLDGQDDGVEDGAPLGLSSRSFTLEFWSRRTFSGRRQVVLGLGSKEPGGRLAVGFTAQDQLFFEFDRSGSALVSPAYPLDLNQWVHWACVFDLNTGKRALFRQGLVVAQDTPATPFEGRGQFFLGRDHDGAFFQGELDDVRVWTVARTAFGILQDLPKRLTGLEDGLVRYFTFDEASGPEVLDLSASAVHARLLAEATRVVSTAPTGIPPRYLTLVENNDPALGALPVVLHIVRVDDGPFPGDLKPILPDNVFDERLTLRHSSDFGGDPDPLEFEWWMKPDDAGFDPEDLPLVNPDGTIAEARGWVRYTAVQPASGRGVNDLTLGQGAEAGLLALGDNWFVCRYRGYEVGLRGTNVWSDWIGDPSGTSRPRAALAEGWVKRVIRGLNPFDARVQDFHAAPVNTYASMLVQAGKRYEGDIAFNPEADNLNSIGLIEAYQTVLNRARRLSIDGSPAVNFNPANNALLLAASRIADLYQLLGNEAYADAQDPTIGFGTTSLEYGSAAASIFAFQNQLDSLLGEELVLLRGRDDTFAGVGAPPVYNRLLWNFTLGEGEVAYQQSYNINDQNADGFIDERDARILYPQGHGDAWGHYLTALTTYYTLLRHPNFTWVPRTERVNVAGIAQEIDFLDERKFAALAAARARTGREIVNLTYRENYVEDPAGQWQGYQDSRADRAWGVTDWARRAGSGAYFDWLTANALLPSTDPDPTHVGIRKIDRSTVRELAEIAEASRGVQDTLGTSDLGLNPIGLAKGVVVFDLDPTLNEVGSTAQIGRRAVQGLTHFDQIMERAVKSLQNAIRVFDEANRSTQMLRRNQDSIDALTQNATAQERDFKNRLIEVYGYPYAGDIGPGQPYPSGYDGPDLYRYMYIDRTGITGANTPTSAKFRAFFRPADAGDGRLSFYAGDRQHEQGSITDPDTLETSILAIDYPVSASDYGFEATSAMGQRRAPGRVQEILSDLVQANAQLAITLQNYDGLVADIADAIALLQAKHDLDGDEIDAKGTQLGVVTALNVSLGIMKGVETNLRRVTTVGEKIAEVTKTGLPTVVGFATDVTSAARALVKGAAAGTSIALDVTADNLAVAQNAIELSKQIIPLASDLGVEVQTQEYEVLQAVKQIEAKMRNEAAARLAVYNQVEAIRQIVGRYDSALAEGLRIQEELVSFRRRAAAEVTEARYQDLTFRIFRNDALQKYRAQFDLAARYTYLAATAYDYEVNLLGDDPRAGGDFLAQIVRQRSLGQVIDGEPVVGQPGLADLLGRLIQNFDSLRGQFGFNNPQIEGNQLSLRHDLFRIVDDDPANPRDVSDTRWRNALRDSHNSAGASSRVVRNLWDLPEFRRFCRPFAPESAGPQPGLVIRFPSTVQFAMNFFGLPLGAGDSTYDASRFATKVRSVGVWFSNYDASGLSLTPRVYLVPVGADVLRSPSQRDDFATREWRVVDQAIPVPFAIGSSALKDPLWIPIADSLGGSFVNIRRHSQLRAFHDDGFDLAADTDQIVRDARLIGRSVWNTDWLLIIPGGAFLANPQTGLETFLTANTDIKVLLQTYSYSGL